MDIFEEIADERRRLADLLTGLSLEQRAAPSLCRGWTVRDVAGHLIVPLEVGLPKFALAMLISLGNFDRANDRLAREQGRRPFEEIVAVLRRRAESRFTPPGAGPEAPLTDVLVHGSDICWPLGLTRHIAEERLLTSLTFLTTPAAGSLVGKDTLTGLRLETEGTDWSHGTGPTVRGEPEVLLLAMTGRPAALDRLHGDGVATLRDRLTGPGAPRG